MINISHHGAVSGVTGSCHELSITPLDHIRALVVTHVHIDHVGRIPYLLAAGFNGPIICSEPSAIMLPEILEDALDIRFQPAGHILGSAYVECDVTAAGQAGERIVFSGDLGAAHAPLLTAPVSPERADRLVIEQH